MVTEGSQPQNGDESPEAGRAEDPHRQDAAGSPPLRFEPVARFKDPYSTRPQRYIAGEGQVPPSIPMDPILPYIAPPIPRRRRSDWPVLAVALVISSLIMGACCIAGFALYTGYGAQVMP